MTRRVLLPLALAYGAGAALRESGYRHGLFARTRLPAPVISVGNLSVGGSGKTPLVAWIAERLIAASFPVAILSRGYAGRFSGECLVVGDGERVLADSEAAGDEAVMLARALPRAVVAVGVRRDVVGRAVLERFGRRTLLLDDGFQHLRLARDLDLLCLGPGDADDWPLPAGRLREFARAAERAHVRVRVLEAGEPKAGADVFARRQVAGFCDLHGNAQPAPRRAALVSAIARPERFAADVAAAGVSVVSHARYRDHRRVSAAELAKVARAGQTAGAEAIVTTAKDAARWPEAALPLPVRVMKSELVVLDEAPFLERLFAAAGKTA